MLPIDAIEYYIDHPCEYVIDILKAKPTKQQESVLRSIPEAIKLRRGLATKSGHGTGKTAIEAWVIKWFMDTRPFPKIIVTAPTQHQLYDVTWSELAKWDSLSLTKGVCEWTKTSFRNSSYPDTWFAVARTSNKAENMQGFHSEHLLFIIEEASGVPQDILEVVEGTQTQENALIMMLGNPTQISGGFYDAFNNKRHFYQTFTLNSEESEIVDKRYCENLALKYGKDSDIYRVRVLGEFPKAEPDTLIPLNLVEAAVIRELAPQIVTEVEIGVDVARFGNDETIIASRQGNEVIIEKVLTKRDLMTTVGEVVQVIRKYADKQVSDNVDDSGLGGGVTDRLKELATQRAFSATITGVNNGERARDSEKFVNVGSEMWFAMRERVKTLKLPNDNDLIAQLSTRKYSMTSAGKQCIETKEHMKERGLTSPDRADAVILTLRSLIYAYSNRASIAFAC